MSIYDREYVARFAPVTTMAREALERRTELPESWAPSAFRRLRPDDPIPVRLSHDKSERGEVGRLGTLYTFEGWHCATFTLDPNRTLSPIAVDRIKVGTPVSMGHCDTFQDQWVEDANVGVRRWTHTYLTELSILGPGERPGIEGAQIIRVREPTTPVNLHDLNERLRRLGIKTELRPVQSLPESKPNPKPKPREVIHHPPPPTRRARDLQTWFRNAPDDLDGETLERLVIAASESAIDRAWREHCASRATARKETALEPTLIRHNAGGRVLRIR